MVHIEGLLVWSIVGLRDVLRVALNAKGITIVHPVSMHKLRKTLLTLLKSLAKKIQIILLLWKIIGYNT